MYRRQNQPLSLLASSGDLKTSSDSSTLGVGTSTSDRESPFPPATGDTSDASQSSKTRAIAPSVPVSSSVQTPMAAVDLTSHKVNLKSILIPIGTVIAISVIIVGFITFRRWTLRKQQQRLVDWDHNNSGSVPIPIESTNPESPPWTGYPAAERNRHVHPYNLKYDSSSPLPLSSPNLESSAETHEIRVDDSEVAAESLEQQPQPQDLLRVTNTIDDRRHPTNTMESGPGASILAMFDALQGHIQRLEARINSNIPRSEPANSDPPPMYHA
ncbi:hypothetical protein VKT23_009951 [Stygiomarasmius scandens]|uniref:Uncharacterized protein n=1 Tax=Marasmiellus scandens TaxID=2682957 RepID=A0ABR1JF98_9AGAR